MSYRCLTLFVIAMAFTLLSLQTALATESIEDPLAVGMGYADPPDDYEGIEQVSISGTEGERQYLINITLKSSWVTDTSVDSATCGPPVVWIGDTGSFWLTVTQDEVEGEFEAGSFLVILYLDADQSHTLNQGDSVLDYVTASTYLLD